MSYKFENLKKRLKSQPRIWLVTGVAGFIGSNLLETLLNLGQEVVGMDNFSTGFQHNLDDVRRNVGEEAWKLFQFIEGDILDLDTCREACRGVDFVLHQAALGSVPRSISNPIATNRANIEGFLNMLVAARDEGVKRFVYAASSSTYGDHPGLPKIEDKIGTPLSPYAVTKLVNELYADVFGRTYNFQSIGLRYFNVFGRRQDPKGAYAAVIPCWVGTMLEGKTCIINGDGETSRDFTYIENVIQANLLAAATSDETAVNQIYNVANGDKTTLNDLYFMIQERLLHARAISVGQNPQYVDFREGDVRHSQADIGKAGRFLGYKPSHSVAEGLDEALAWYAAQASQSSVT